jgi:hypothetical protein
MHCNIWPNKFGYPIFDSLTKFTPIFTLKNLHQIKYVMEQLRRY